MTVPGPSDRPVVAVVVKSFPPAFRSGGPGRSISGLISVLGDEFDFRIFTSMDDNGHDLRADGIVPETWTERAGAPTFGVDPGPRGAATLVRELIRLDPDVVYLNSFFNPVFSLVPLLLRRVGWARHRRWVVAPRGEFNTGALGLKSSRKRVYLRLLSALGALNRIVWQASSDLEARAINNTVGGDAAVIEAAVVRRLSAPAVNHEPPSEPGPIEILFLSKIDRMKNLETALEAFARAREAGSDSLRLTIAGPVKDQQYWDECQSLLVRLRLGDAVTVHGPVPPDDVVDFMADFDLFFLPTRGENYGHVILEALTAGLPVILGDTTPWGDVADRDAGWTAAPDDVRAFAAHLAAYAGLDQSERDAMASRARDFVRSTACSEPSIDANRRLLSPVGRLDSRPRVAVVHYSFPETTQTFHHRRHRVMAESGLLEAIHHLRRAKGTIESRSASILQHARPLQSWEMCAGGAGLLRPRHLKLLAAGLTKVDGTNGEGGRFGAVVQAAAGIAIGRRLRASHATAIHATFATAPLTMAIFAKAVSGLPLTVEVHSPHSAASNPDWLAWKLGHADEIVAISEYTAGIVERAGLTSTIVHCGIDAGDPEPCQSELAGDDVEAFDVLAVGSLGPKKGHHVLIQAAALLAQDRPSLQVGIIGEGTERPRLERQVSQSGAPVTLLGALDPEQVGRFRRKAKVGTLACVRTADGDEDGVPVSLMEFMADGVPVVSTDVAGVRELLDDGAVGALVAADDAPALAAALDRALNDDSWREAARRHGRDRVLAFFENSSETARLAGLWEPAEERP